MPERDSYSLTDYGWMINDRSRTQPFVDALERAVKPGSVVLDIGTGTGIFAFLACRFGAERVYAIEPDDAIEVAKSCAASNPGADRITWIQGFSTEIELPEQVDVVIADLHGNLPFHTGNMTSMIDARQRHMKPGGCMIPARVVLRAVPAHAPDEYENIISPWSRNDYGIDFSAGQGFVCNAVRRAHSGIVAPGDLLSTPCSWGTIDYGTVESTDVDGHLEWLIERPGILHGMYVWFDCEVASGLGFSNAPDLSSLPYGRSFFPLQQAIEVETGDQMRVRISATLVGAEHIYRWDTRILDAAGMLKAEFRQSTFKDRPINIGRLRRSTADFLPTLTLDGEIDHHIMQAMAQSRPLGQIASDLFERYPKRFPDLGNALNHVRRLSVMYAA